MTQNQTAEKTPNVIGMEPEEFKGLADSPNYPAGYCPTEDEEYMGAKQLAFFKDMLIAWKTKLQQEALETVEGLREFSSIEPDPADQAILETQQASDLKARDRARKLIRKIDEAISRIDDEDFGYCEETGDPIGVKRLLARPIATLCIEEKRRQEKQETAYAG